MTQVKFFQVRDAGTHIPVMCVMVLANDADDSRELRRAGFGKGTSYFLLTNLIGCQTRYDPFGWDDDHTMGTAQRHISEHWPSLGTGDVIDCEFIRGEATTCKVAE
jgi:hypothetical protein